MRSHLYPALLLCGIVLLMTACSPVKTLATNQYQLSAYSDKNLLEHSTDLSILITAPEAISAYQSNQMLYVTKNFELKSFVENSWVSPPADMLFPLIVQSVQHLGFFHAVSSSPHDEPTDYRLDTQLIAIKQNFLCKPSVLELTTRAVLTNVQTSRVVASQIFCQRIRCPMENPYGGVLAANIASRQLTAELSNFVVTQVKQDVHQIPKSHMERV